MPLRSAGILLYRMRGSGLQVLLVHPGGPYFARKDLGAWSIPKGLYEGDEDGLAAARREFREELGCEVPDAHFTQLPSVKQKGGKIVEAWAAPGDIDVAEIASNTFSMEYPYKSGTWRDYPEVDKAEWFDLQEAANKILPAQVPLLTALARLLHTDK